jgi:hypothetical protein
MRSLKIAGLVLGALLFVVLPASAAGRFPGAAGRFRGGIVVAPSFSLRGWYGPYSWYGPYAYGPFLPYESYPMAYSNVGEVKLKTNVKDADVFINGAFAGKAAKLKSMSLPPATYDLEVRATGYAPFTSRIYVVPGKTLHVEADLTVAPKS